MDVMLESCGKSAVQKTPSRNLQIKMKTEYGV